MANTNRRDHALENRILRLQLARDHALLEWLLAYHTAALPADACAAIADALRAGGDCLLFTEAHDAAA